MNETHDPEYELDQMLDRAVEDAFKVIEEREIPKYDGVQGVPDEWVPEWAILYFEGYRDRLLSDRGFEVSALLKFIEQYRKKYYREEHTDSVVAPGFHCPETYPNGQSVDRHCFHDEIGFLARLKWCVEIGPEKGLDELSGKHGVDAARGHKTIDSARQGGKVRAAKFVPEKERAKQAAEKILATRTRKPSKFELARLVVEEIYTEMNNEEKKRKADSLRHWL